METAERNGEMSSRCAQGHTVGRAATSPLCSVEQKMEYEMKGRKVCFCLIYLFLFFLFYIKRKLST